jgi:hypothetical protein
MRCGCWENRVNLQFQHQIRGAQLANTYILVCKRCLDIPTYNLTAITLPADPVPIFYPSVENFEQDESDYRSVGPVTIDPVTGIPIPSQVLRVTQDCQNRTTQPFGQPVGLTQNAVMPFNGATLTEYGVPLQVLSVTANGTSTVQVTCSAVHQLQPNYQVSIEGLSNTAANGFYSVTVLGATTFTYQTYGNIAAGNLITPTTRIITCLVGLPYGYATIPQIAGPTLTPMFAENGLVELETGTGFIALESGMGYVELEDGP